MKGEYVYIVTYNGGLLGIYAELRDAVRDALDYKRNDYKGVKVDKRKIH